MKLKIANTGNDLVEFLNETRDFANFQLKPILISEQSSWLLKNGTISHNSNGFFQVVGIQNRENPNDQSLILFQPQSALTGLIFHQTNDDIFVLLQARVEPGNTGIIQYGPTIQSTPANYLRLHGGKATSYIEYFVTSQSGISLLSHSMQHDLGSKYYQKSKSHHFLLAENWLETDQNMIWASLSSILSLILKDNFFNADLRSLLAVFNWTTFFGDSAKNLIINKSLPCFRFPDRKKFQIIPVDKLVDWEVSNKGVLPKENQNTGISFFNFSCNNREVPGWSQPLFTVQGRANVQLMFNKSENGVKFLLSVDHEAGISTSFAFYPSYYNFPERNDGPLQVPENGQIIKEMIQCDEGGRFYRNNVNYQLIELKGTSSLKGNQFWVTKEQMVTILEASNTCSFPLRCISSLALELLHPEIF